MTFEVDIPKVNIFTKYCQQLKITLSMTLKVVIAECNNLYYT